ncbi:hypothetical protein TTHERM_00827140 (macronuclear) [Tetrahymena thermophila SB210]|uniref:Alpha/beta hydrolase fold-3 domain-containing protein n=1 Tax=Tetrahymena thermophila (strain SB210) TaxID=312017 RepID=Q22EF5_TETTS|nr:hypothetical protein TTHERM_00827140 [Tetrahymena thermophila SB210]EAR83697.2 hypothetical protein TTHERM_00827140 [Tetrahymena thermophila SB210]|eukprot:XP_001031360.2 hypothetical protein TTHERM_00827140 [Tetrahymena thermophila SB210]
MNQVNQNMDIQLNHYKKDPELQEIPNKKIHNLPQCQGEDNNDFNYEEQQIEDVENESQQKIEKAYEVITKMNSVIENEDIYKNPAKAIQSIDCLNQEQQDYLIQTVKNLDDMMIELHNAIIKYGMQENVVSQLRKSLQTGNVLLYQLRSIISAYLQRPNILEQQVPVERLGEKQNLVENVNKPNEENKEEQKEINITEKQEDKTIDDQFLVNIKNRDQINIITLQVGAKVLNTYFEEIKNICISIQAPKLKKKLQSYINDHKIVQAKLNTITEFLPYAVIFDKNDIFALDQENHYIWKILKQHIEYVQLAPQEELQKQFKAIVKAVLLGNAMAAKGAERKSKLGQWFQRNLSAVYYLCCPQTSQRKAHIFFSNPDQQTAISVWNMMEKSVVYQALKIVLPSIKYNKKIYIERDNLRYTKELILEEMKNQTLNSLFNPFADKKIVDSSCQQNQDSYYDQLFKKDLVNKVKVRILSSKKLVRPPPKEDKKYKDIKWHEKLVIHIHGGGFVAMGTRSHQIYSRKWVNFLGVPIFSIDYSKAPEHPYPEGLDDCFQAYQWIVNNVSKYFNIIPNKIIVVGDSAGGNLTIALTQLCIKYNVRIPDGIVPIYPALSLNLKKFTPSYLISLDDQILPHMFLKMCLQAYVNKDDGFDASTDPFLSPTCVSDEIIKKFPPVRLQIGNKDPLHDESYRFLHKLINNGKDVKMIVYLDMPHGYLNYDAPGGMKYAKKCVDDAANALEEFLKK